MQEDTQPRTERSRPPSWTPPRKLQAMAVSSAEGDANSGTGELEWLPGRLEWAVSGFQRTPGLVFSATAETGVRDLAVFGARGVASIRCGHEF